MRPVYSRTRWQPWAEAGRMTQSPVQPRRRWLSPWITTGIAVAAIIAVLVAIAPWDAQRRQAIADQVVVWTNPPEPEVVTLAEASEMSQTGRRIFFASLPSLEEGETFNEHCGSEGDTVLGCYDGKRIYVFRVADERLAGTNEVTAAHEMLHAAYSRLSRAERGILDALVEEFVAGLPADDPGFDLVETYPTDQQRDEWHSRLGTEYGSLSPELEEHYAQYFENRQAVLHLSEEATGELRDLEGQIEALVAEIDSLAADLDERSSDYDRWLANLNADIDDFNQRADSGGFTSQAQFDAERAELIDRSERLEVVRLKLNADVDHYNQLVEQLSALDADYADLYSSLDSTAPPPGGATE